MLLDMAPREKVSTVASAAIWALGRIGARAPLYGPLNTVVPADVAADWCRAADEAAKGTRYRAAGANAACTQDRRSLSRRKRIAPGKILSWLGVREVPAHFAQLIAEVGQLEEAEQNLIFGESLPQGLRLAP